jgi:hypothetical protein
MNKPTLIHLKVLQRMHRLFGDAVFTTEECAVAMSGTQKAMSSYLSTIVRDGGMERVQPGLFRVIRTHLKTPVAIPFVEKRVQIEPRRPVQSFVIHLKDHLEAQEEKRRRRNRQLARLPHSIPYPTTERLRAGR